MLTPEREKELRKVRLIFGASAKVEMDFNDFVDMLDELDYTRMLLKDALEEGGKVCLEELKRLRQENEELKNTNVELLSENYLHREVGQTWIS